ncbi:MAG: hypothetical protein ABSB59_18230 [Streptosporangiaceae bacterium]|jgi:hypothetical protein
MRFKQSVTAAFAVAAGVAISVGAPATSAHAATTVVTLPITSYSHMLVDSAHKHLFITSGSGSTSILVTDYSGQTVATIGNEPGATGLALSPDGSTVYAALAAGDAVSAISTSTLAETARYATGTGTDPTYVAATSGKIWFSYDAAAAQASIGSIDPSTSPATVTLSAAAGTWSIPPVLAATASGELVASEPSQSPNELATYDVSTGTATVLAPQQFFTEAGNFKSMAITPDGQDVVTASGAPYQQEIFKISDLSAAGTYPTTPYPNSVAIAADGTVAAGTTIGSNEVFMFAPGGSTPLNTISFGSNQLADDGVALTPDDSLLFAITLQNAPTLNIIPNPAQPAPPAQDPTSTAMTCSPNPDAIGQATTCTATVTDTAASPTTPTGTVTFGASANDGSFSASTCTLAPAATSGQASCSVSYTPSSTPQVPGSVTLSGAYTGDSSHASSAGTTVLTIPTPQATATTLTCQPGLLLRDKCTAAVSDTSSGTATTPTGTVTFTSSRHGIFSKTTCTLSGTGTSASCFVYYTPLFGSQTLTATYGGDATHQASTGKTTLK